MAKSKLVEEVIQHDVQVSEEVAAEVKKAVAPKDAYTMPEPKKIDAYPGHSRRDFRND
jgi:hypothetical protein